MKDNIQAQIHEARQCMGCMHEGLIVTSTDGTIVETSPAAEHILEAPSLSLKGKQVRDLCDAPATYDDMVRQTAPAGRVLNQSFIVLAGDNKRKIVNLSIQRVGEGESMRFVHVFQDCADLGTMEERLVQSERLATIGRFASQIAHEIRNPLSSITLNVELLEDELEELLPDEEEELLEDELELEELEELLLEDELLLEPPPGASLSS